VSGEPTALLLIRFHQNVLGKRPDGRLPMAKDEALREAKEWLRTLPDKERRKYFDAPPDLGTSGPTRPRPPVNVDDRFSFAHPRFWAGIVLVGDPH
jgi:CHAT domain-containing protein